VIVVEPTGAETQVALRIGGTPIVAAFRDRIRMRPGERIALRPDPAHAHLFDEISGERLN
jgi:multiple sugar transport system ATP-binding protein